MRKRCSGVGEVDRMVEEKGRKDGSSGDMEMEMDGDVEMESRMFSRTNNNSNSLRKEMDSSI